MDQQVRGEYERWLSSDPAATGSLGAAFEAGYRAGEAKAFSGLDEPEISAFDEEHVEELLNERRADHLSAKIMRLLVAMDGHHLARMALVYPRHVNALQRWRLHGKPVAIPADLPQRFVTEAEAQAWGAGHPDPVTSGDDV